MAALTNIPHVPEFLAPDDALAALDLTVAGDDASPDAFVALAWQLRQRDPARALALAHEAETRLAGLAREASRRPRRLPLCGVTNDALPEMKNAAILGD